ncbi:putative secreted protein [Streptomyces davaonensis JCM 4913]|uniref:Putative secreted protein n=1 Tax=Streptomyces davaonensis (strain DSM 101723 / JCM 4913 / KCC S-0913 / 768) TaxID=1214101 RepID=K4RB32_STRDJ|nr:hypothetical protein [Streptomyces davaonensis]CCK30004.1 putative secreted protein [Streptomyces davaonensis JCM 4913]
MTTAGLTLYARSRALPATVAALAATTALALWSAHALDPDRRFPLAALTPLLAAAAIGTSLHTPSDELDRTAARPWWHPRLLHLLTLTTLATALLPLAVLTGPETFGPPAMIHTTLACTGLTAGAAVILGAGLSWLPLFGYASVMYVLEPRNGAGTWATAGALFVAGVTAYVIRGPRKSPA